MARRDSTQLNIRSRPARERAAQLARETGRTITQVVEDAVLAYRAPPKREPEVVPEGMFLSKSGLLVMKPTGRVITMEDTNRMIDLARNRDLWGEDED